MNYLDVFLRNEWIYYYYSKISTTVQKYYDTTFEASCIIDNLWLGAISSSCNREKLHEHNIDTIVSAILGATAPYPFDFDYERASLADTETENIIANFYRLLPIIHSKLLQQKGVLVHCKLGKSRSCSIVAAYLIFYKQMTTDEALEFIRNKRSQIDPNPGYIRQLRQFEMEVCEERKKKDN
jgi:dual specificity phosphatase 12